MVLRPGATHYDADLVGRRLRHHRRPPARASTTPTRRSSTPRARPPTRRRSSTSSSCGPSGPTTSPTAPTCATSPPARRWWRPSASARARSASRTSTRPSCSWSSGRTRAPTTRGCSPRWRRRSQHGARIISINPLQEAGLVRFKNPQNAKGLAGRAPRWPTCTCRSGSTATSPSSRRSAHCWSSGTRSTTTSSTQYTHRLRGVRRRTSPTSTGTKVEASTGLTREQITEAARMIARLPGHRHLLGDGHHPAPQRGRRRSRRSSTSRCCRATSASPAPGVCPVRGHSNVQGDRTMGIWERVPDHFLDALRDEFGFEPPREHGLRHRRLDRGAARRQDPGLLRDGRQLRGRRPRHRRSPRRRCATPR